MENKRTLIVVGADSSIGDVLVPELIEQYEDVILTEVPAAYGGLVEKYREYAGEAKLHLQELDVRSKEHIHNLEVYIDENGLVIDSLIYLAGINILAPALEVTEDIWDRVMEINLKGFFFMARMVANNMILNGGGSILGVASQHGVVANIDRAAYCASKAGMIHLAKELALEWARYGIRVNVVSPTMILSEKNKDMLEGARAKKEYLAKIPLKKYAVPEDISAAILFLNSEKAAMMTGQNMIIDGGWTIC
ncbi:MAG: SDR family oxidoreductase [Lachnospiraceae bacterium]|nr:SDR family oxidoreductase [Lachnospiraceae bacterium]